MLDGNKIWVGTGNLNAEDGSPENRCYLLLNQANRHGIISGASGTGKTVTLKLLAEGFSQAGVPTFMADVKGDVAVMAQAGLNTRAHAICFSMPVDQIAGFRLTRPGEEDEE